MSCLRERADCADIFIYTLREKGGDREGERERDRERVREREGDMVRGRGSE